ncbi:hypothetical protein IAQ61_003844 [Plenodomus lingam]|uniref:uncharacterized protein n=1 Tax=Leptosphaeria maculans TaxID=5022 RepID=UPI003318225C|nr:hypothetical protein IAQ61_003844 [Plenodomus lingam]
MARLDRGTHVNVRSVSGSSHLNELGTGTGTYGKSPTEPSHTIVADLSNQGEPNVNIVIIYKACKSRVKSP